jgi:hypothetical protein
VTDALARVGRNGAPSPDAHVQEGEHEDDQSRNRDQRDDQRLH